MITGAIFVLIVLLFRHGIWGTARNLIREQVIARRSRPRS
jgi:branched-chain amino acid transport system permease protein